MTFSTQSITRRTMLAQTGLAAAALTAAGQVRADSPAQPVANSTERKGSFKFSLNTATIRGQKLSIVEEVEIAAKAGYQAVEPWLEELHRYVGGGGKPADLKKRIVGFGAARAQLDWFCRLGQRRRGPPHRRPGAMEARRRSGGLDRRHPHGRAPPGARTLPSTCGGWPSDTGNCST